MIKQEECIECMTINCLTDDQKLNENKKRTGGDKMKTTSQIATENKLAANDLNLKSRWKKYLEIKNEESEKSRKEALI
mgnify:CR=1 FL=1